MPKVEATAHVDVPPMLAFAVSQTTGDVRLRWDPFIRSQRLLDGADVAGKGVRTETVSRHRLRMVSQYASFAPPHRVGMRMVEGPWFFAKFGGGWIFADDGAGGTDATWRYTFTVRPPWLSVIADPIGRWLLGRDIRKRIAAWTDGCADPVVVAAAEELVARFRTDTSE